MQSVISMNVATGEVTERDMTAEEIAAIPQPPPAPKPQTVTRFQARAALMQAGLLDDVEALMANPATPAIQRLAWADAQEFRRSSPTVAAMAAALGLSSAQVDALFEQAAGIEA